MAADGGHLHGGKEMPAALTVAQPDPSLLWLFYALLAFLLVTIIAGSLTEKTPGDEAAPKRVQDATKPVREARKAMREKKPAK